MNCVMCDDLLLQAAMGHCSRCLGYTQSIGCAICSDCSKKSGDCEVCGKPVERELTNEEKAIIENRKQKMLEVLARIAERRAKRR